MLALEGIKVLDLTQVVAGPFATESLADMGAEVIKVEAPAKKSEMPAMSSILGIDYYHFTLNRGKKSLVLNLRDPKGRDIFYEMVKKADVVIDNYRAGVTTRLGIDYPTLSKINHGIICCSISGFGPTGPYSHRPAFDGIIQAMSGIMSITGEPGRESCVTGMPVCDLSTGLFAAIGILGALHSRDKTGVGQNISVSLLASGVSMIQSVTGEYFGDGKVSGPNGGGRYWNNAQPYGAYKTKNGNIFLASSLHYENFCKAVGRNDLLSNPLFDTKAKRRNNRKELSSVIEKIMEQNTTEEWLRIFEEEDVPCGQINNMEEVFRDPQVIQLGMLVDQNKNGTKLKIIGNPIKMSGVKEKFEPAPLVGENTDEILGSLLGYSQKKIQELRDQEVVL